MKEKMETIEKLITAAANDINTILGSDTPSECLPDNVDARMRKLQEDVAAALAGNPAGNKETVGLDAALNLIKAANAILVQTPEFRGERAKTTTANLTGDPENEFLHLRWTSNSGDTYTATFKEGNNREVTAGCTPTVTLTDTEGDQIKLGILQP